MTIFLLYYEIIYNFFDIICFFFFVARKSFSFYFWCLLGKKGERTGDFTTILNSESSEIASLLLCLKLYFDKIFEKSLEFYIFLIPFSSTLTYLSFFGKYPHIGHSPLASLTIIWILWMLEFLLTSLAKIDIKILFPVERSIISWIK